MRLVSYLYFFMLVCLVPFVCDDHSLKEVQHLPFLEIAKWFTRTRCSPSLHPLRKEVKERRLIPALLTAVARQGDGSWSVKLE